MKASLFVLFCFTVFLGGCAQTPVQYRLAKEVELGSTKIINKLPFGVTQKQIGERRFRIIAKLNKLSNQLRAHKMAVYHSALLAEEQGFDAFVIERRNQSGWCGAMRNINTLNLRDVSGGPITELTITLVHAEQITRPKGKLRTVNEAKLATETSVNAEESATEMENNTQQRFESCRARMSPKTNKVRSKIEKIKMESR